MVTTALSCIVYEIWRLIGRKSRNFYAPPVFSAPAGGAKYRWGIKMSAPSLAIFKRRLKTHLFGQSFGWQLTLLTCPRSFANKDGARCIVLLKLTTDRHEAVRGLYLQSQSWADSTQRQLAPRTCTCFRVRWRPTFRSDNGRSCHGLIRQSCPCCPPGGSPRSNRLHAVERSHPIINKTIIIINVK